jgi:hypothetical protein
VCPGFDGFCRPEPRGFPKCNTSPGLVSGGNVISIILV